MNIRLGVNEAARVGLTRDQSAHWRATNQIALIGCARPDGTPYRVYPDVFVYTRPFDPDSSAISIRENGPPVLVVEVLSEATYDVDLNVVNGKGYSYARAGIPEYLTIDCTRRILPEGIRAWRLVDRVYQPWPPDTNGRWQSQQVGIAIGLEEGWATVYTSDGRRMLREGEVEAERARMRQEITALRAENERLRRELEELRGWL